MERKPDKVMVPCDECKSLVDLRFPIHICTIWKGGVRVKSTKKLWNPTLQLWVVHPDEVREKKELDQEERELGWQKLEKVAGEEREKKEETEASFQTCEIPQKLVTHSKSCTCNNCRPRDLKYHLDSCRCFECWRWKFGIGAIQEVWASFSQHNNYHSSSTYTYIDVKPWSGVDRAKFPNTWDFLFAQYYLGNRWYEGLTIPGREYEDRILRGIYAPEPKRWSRYDNWKKQEEEREKEKKNREKSKTYTESPEDSEKERKMVQKVVNGRAQMVYENESGKEEKSVVELVNEEDDEDSFWMKWSSYGEA